MTSIPWLREHGQVKMVATDGSSVPPSVADDMVTKTEPTGYPRMDGLITFLSTLRDHQLVAGRLQGILHLAIGRRIETTKGEPVSNGATWRELAAVLKAVRFDKELGREVGADPDTLSPRDRERYWYSVIGLAKVDSADASSQAEKLISTVKSLGYVIGPSPVNVTPLPMKPVKVANTETPDEKKKKKK